MNFFKVVKLQDLFKRFYFLSLFSGFASFSYPSSKFKASFVGVTCFLVSSLYWTISCYRVLQFFSRMESKGYSQVFTVGATIIEGMVSTTVLVCIIVNFVQRKTLFKLIKTFERLDEKVSQIFCNNRCFLKYFLLERRP